MTKSNGTASDPQRKLAAALPPDEPVAGSDGHPESIPPSALLAQVLDRANLQRALKHVRRNQGAPGIDGLTPREIEVLRHIASGLTAKEAAALLGISPKTAENHIQNLYAKIGVSTRAGAELYALERGLVADEIAAA